MPLSNRLYLAVMVSLAVLLPPMLFPEVWLFGKTLYYMDLGWFHLPLRDLIAESWRSGQWPLWNPYSWNGFPLMGAAAASALSPLNLPFFVGLAPGMALNIEVLAHTSIAALSAFALARQVRISPGASLLAALSYACGGYMMAQVACLEVMLGVAWVPLICALLLSANESHRAARALMAGGVLALQIYSTHPQISVYTSLLLAALSSYCAWFAWRALGRHTAKELLRPFTYLVLVMVVGIGLSAPQVAASAELLLQSRRAVGLSIDEQTVLSMPPTSLLTLLFPRLFLLPTSTWRTTGIYDEYHFYIGILPLICAVISFIAARRGNALLRFSWAFTLLTVVLALGRFTPLYALILELPGASIFRAPGRWLFITAVLAIILVGKGADFAYAWLVDPNRRPDVVQLGRTLTILFLALCLSVPVALVLRPPNAVTLAGEDAYSVERMASRAQVAARLLPESIAFMLTGGLALAAFWIVGVRWRSPRAFAVLVILIAFGDLFVAGGELTRDASYWDAGRPIADFVLAQDRLARIFSAGQYADGAAQLWQDHPALMRVYASSGSDLSQGLQREDDYIMNVSFLRGLQMSSTRWLIMPGKAEAPLDRFGLLAAPVASSLNMVYETSGATIFAVPDSLPRAYVVFAAVQAVTQDAALQLLNNSAFDIHSMAAVESEQPLPSFPARQGAPLVPARIVAYEPARVSLESDVPGDGLLVLTDTYYPGWHAWVDGVEQPILRTNYLFRGVLVHAGHHQVEFSYQPLSFRIGLIIAGVTGLLIVCSTAVTRYMRLPMFSV